MKKYGSKWKILIPLIVAIVLVNGSRKKKQDVPDGDGRAF